MQPTMRFNPSCTEVFTSGGKTAYLTGRWFIREWLDKEEAVDYMIMVELTYLNELGQQEFDWWNGDNLTYALDGPVQGPKTEIGQYEIVEIDATGNPINHNSIQRAL